MYSNLSRTTAIVSSHCLRTPPFCVASGWRAGPYRYSVIAFRVSYSSFEDAFPVML
jgi:hypothetical protein